MEFKEIIKLPTVINNNHESVLRSFQILNNVKKMLERGDSNETISDFINEAEYLGNEYQLSIKSNNNLTK